MTVPSHPAAPHHLPPFITGPGEVDVLMVVMIVVLISGTLAVGILFFRLHTLPERIAHKTKKLQFEIVAVLGLLALFTHIHLFWVASLLLALIDIPDFGAPLARMAGSLEKMAGLSPGQGAEEGGAAPAKDDASPQSTGGPGQPRGEPTQDVPAKSSIGENVTRQTQGADYA